LDLEKQNLAEELQQARAELAELETLTLSPAGTDKVKPISLPDAAELLNTIRQQNPKSKVSLRDIEAILAAIETTS